MSGGAGDVERRGAISASYSSILSLFHSSPFHPLTNDCAFTAHPRAPFVSAAMRAVAVVFL
jgi:hypothetical protein